MFFDLLDKLREKPESARLHIALLISAVLTCIIFLIWFSVVTLTWTNHDSSIKKQDPSDSSALFGSIRDPLRDYFGRIGASFGGIFDAFGVVQYDASEQK